MTTPDTTTPEATIEENAAKAATEIVETEPAASEATSEADVESEAPAVETAAEAPAAEVTVPEAATAETEMAATAETGMVAPAETATATPTAEVASQTAVAAPAAVVEEDPQTAVFSLVTFFLAALPIIGVILNAIAVARAGKEGFDLWLARWGLALAIVETVGALILVSLGYYLGLLTAGAV